MTTIARLSHVGFNVNRDLFDQECEFWENVVGLRLVHALEGRNAFFTADGLRDHEFILFCTDETVTSHDDVGCMLNHVAFDVATDAEVEEISERLNARGLAVEDHNRGRRRADFTSPAGIHFEINTPPYAHPRARD